jgi:hypothetical protein
MRACVLEWRECACCGGPSATAHHVIARGQGGDDVRENLVALCGSGTTGCHGLVEDENELALLALGRHIARERPDVVFYVCSKLGPGAGPAWFERRLGVVVA